MNNDAPICVQGLDAKTAIIGAICFTIFGVFLLGGVVWTYLLRAPMPSRLPRLLVTWHRVSARTVALGGCGRCSAAPGARHRWGCAAREWVNISGRAPQTWLGWAVWAWIAVRETSRHAIRKVRQVRDNSVAREESNSNDSTVPVRQLRRPSPRGVRRG